MKTNHAHQVRSPQVWSPGFSRPHATLRLNLPVSRRIHPSDSPNTAGFSLIEVIGVMAIALIVALAFALTTTKSLDNTFATQEAANLQSFASALQRSVLRYQSVPGTNIASNPWYQAIATELGVSPNMVTTSDRNSARLFLVDSTTINGSTVYGGYIQNSAGASALPNPYRMMILSSLSTQTPGSMTGGASFSALWATNDASVPSDLKIQRINLTPSFVNLQLNNVQSTTNGWFRINGSDPPTAVGSGGINAYYIQNTLLTLIDPSTYTTNAELLLTRDFSFFFVGNVWRSVPYIPAYTTAAQTNLVAADLATMFATAATMFSASPGNTNATGGATPTSVLNSMSNFMYAYEQYYPYATNYAATNGNVWPTTGSLYTNASAAQTAVYNAMNGLVGKGFTPGGCQ